MSYVEPLWEVFVRADRGLSHVHVGSLHAPDPEVAVLSARDLYTRRSEGVSLWVVRSEDIHSSDPGKRAQYFEAAAEKPYRHARHYAVPEGLNL
jgi:ring-1,2-phenylacetyl-CoA epoxidase subunit PaaB